MADGTFTTTTTGTALSPGIAAEAKAAKAKAKTKGKAAKAKAKEAEDLAEAQRLAAAATYGGEHAFAELPSARRRDLLTDAWLLMHAPAEERVGREKRQRAAGADPASVPLERTLKNQWRDRREKTARQGKIIALIHDAAVAAVGARRVRRAGVRAARAKHRGCGMNASATGHGRWLAWLDADARERAKRAGGVL